MNIKISIVIFILLSFFNVGAITNEAQDYKNSFSDLEINMANISEFEENGVKLQYKISDNIQKENTRIKECLTKNINGIYKEINENQFEVFDNNFNIKIKMWCEYKFTYVEITLVNKNPKYKTKDLKNILKKVENERIENRQYFFYYEGREKSLDNKYSIGKLADENQIQNPYLLEIENGYTGTGYLQNGDKINFALIKYNTGSHIIIGTPIIIATY